MTVQKFNQPIQRFLDRGQFSHRSFLHQGSRCAVKWLPPHRFWRVDVRVAGNFNLFGLVFKPSWSPTLDDISLDPHPTPRGCVILEFYDSMGNTGDRAERCAVDHPFQWIVIVAAAPRWRLAEMGDT